MLEFGIFKSGPASIFVRTLNNHIVLFALKKRLLTLPFCLSYSIVIGVLSFFKLLSDGGTVV